METRKTTGARKRWSKRWLAMASIEEVVCSDDVSARKKGVQQSQQH